MKKDNAEKFVLPGRIVDELQEICKNTPHIQEYKGKEETAVLIFAKFFSSQIFANIRYESDENSPEPVLHYGETIDLQAMLDCVMPERDVKVSVIEEFLNSFGFLTSTQKKGVTLNADLTIEDIRECGSHYLVDKIIQPIRLLTAIGFDTSALKNDIKPYLVCGLNTEEYSEEQLNEMFEMICRGEIF